MALINCPDCKRQVSNQAKACPNCGHPVSGRGTTVTLRNCPDCVQGQVKDHCNICDGKGVDECYCCDGTGYTSDYGERSRCHVCRGDARKPCDCAGRGYYLKKCETCSGSGQLTTQEFDALMKRRQELIKKQEELNRQAALRAQQEESKRKAEETRRQAEAKKLLEEQAKRKAAEDREKQEALNQKAQELRKSLGANADLINTARRRERDSLCQLCGKKAGVFAKTVPVRSAKVGFNGFVHEKCDSDKAFRTKMPIIMDKNKEAWAWLVNHGYITTFKPPR